MDEYRSGMDSRGNAIFAAGEDNEDYTLWTEEQQAAFWAYYNEESGADFAQEIVDYCVANYADAYGSDIDAPATRSALTKACSSSSA
jgi:peptide/nickel transport system substrate-binding protein